MPVSGSIKTPIMPLQNATIKSPMWPVKDVIEHTQLWGDFDTTIMQTNRQYIKAGETAISERMFAARQPMSVSNFGTETKIGNGELSKVSHETLETSVEAISTIMQKDDQWQGSKNGSYSAMGPTGFQEFNDRSFRSQQARVAKAYEYFNTFG
jgi:hypothetical protein